MEEEEEEEEEEVVVVVVVVVVVSITIFIIFQVYFRALVMSSGTLFSKSLIIRGVTISNTGFQTKVIYLAK